MAYPLEKLEIQVLDDSTDHCADVAAARVESWRRCGVPIVYIHRSNRTGYKAGALEHGLHSAAGELVAVFDADFVPPAHFLRETIPHFQDASVGMVQARWAHLNRDDSLLTRCQAVYLDAHFLIEHGARHRSGRWMNFNGTAGLWRRAAIDHAGGWQHDTLTEDVDLSYRAQLAGYRFVFRPDLACPAELPPEIHAFKSQQHRWTKGSIQAARKLLPRILRAPVSAAVKTEAFFHLTSPMVYVLVTLMVLLFYPALALQVRPYGDGWPWLLIGATLFALGSVSAGVFYVVSQRAQRFPLGLTLLRIPAIMALGIGIALNNARACLEALSGHRSTFVRTPKYNDPAGPVHARLPFLRGGYLWLTTAELGMGCYTLMCARLALDSPYTAGSVPFLLLFAAGYFGVAGAGLRGRMPGFGFGRKRPRREPA